MFGIRKGMSSVVQITILMMLSVIALATIWSYVSGLSNDFEGQLAPTVGCISQKSQIQSACINAEGKIEVKLSKGLDENINDIDMNVRGQSFSCGVSCSSCIVKEDENQKTIYLSPTIPIINGDKLAAAINSCSPELLTLTNC
jgi:ABC-type lipoprotein release transport system permease subunit